VKKRAFLEGHTSEYVRCVDFSPDGQLLASCGDDATVRLWETATGKEKAVLKGHSYPVRCVAFSPDGRTLASGAGGGRFDKPEPGELFLWDVVGGARKAALKGHAGNVVAVAFSPDGKTLAAASYGFVAKEEARDLKLWDVESRRELAHLAQGFGELAFSLDGRTLASESGDGVTLWDVTARKPRRTIRCKSIGNAFAFSPDGKVLAVGTSLPDEEAVKLYDVATGELRRRFDSGDREVSALAFSPDGKILAVARYEHDMQLRDAATGRVIAVLEETQFPPSVAFSPDGRILAAGGADGRVKLWDLPAND
jgi:WD40 repeat protein